MASHESPPPGTVAAADRRREVDQPGFVLHTHPWKETSLVVRFFTRRHGVLMAAAKGARRPASTLRGLLMPFQPLRLAWSGRAEVRVLVSAEREGGVPQLGGTGLMCGFYLNELLVRCLGREDPHEALFDDYRVAVVALARGDVAPAAVLRRFERVLLAALGYGLELEHEADAGARIAADGRYRWVPEHGAVLSLAAVRDDDPFAVRGATLLAMARDDYTHATAAAEAKRLLRALLQHHLGTHDLHTRQIVQDLQHL
ncbi:MAG: DNA repair protein RecO [Burkholderiales bacterium]|jgi:DNA repair protein RecO (recombination protein O)|nr:DNA repair protein RecO [Burkholderiales bacterium]